MGSLVSRLSTRMKSFPRPCAPRPPAPHTRATECVSQWSQWVLWVLWAHCAIYGSGCPGDPSRAGKAWVGRGVGSWAFARLPVLG